MIKSKVSSYILSFLKSKKSEGLFLIYYIDNKEHVQKILKLCLKF